MLMELFIIVTGFAFGFLLTGFVFLETNLLSTKHDLSLPVTIIGSTVIPLIETMVTFPQYTLWVVGFNSIGILCLLFYRSPEHKNPI